MTTLEFKKEVENFFSDKININYKKFKKENPHLPPEFYFLLLAIRIDKIKSILDTPKKSTHSIRTSPRKRKRKEYYGYQIQK